MFDRIELTSFYTVKGEQKEVAIESDGYNNITFQFDNAEQVRSAVKFTKGMDRLTISATMIRVSMNEGKFSSVLDSSKDLYEKAQKIVKELNT